MHGASGCVCAVRSIGCDVCVYACQGSERVYCRVGCGVLTFWSFFASLAVFLSSARLLGFGQGLSRAPFSSQSAVLSCKSQNPTIPRAKDAYSFITFLPRSAYGDGWLCPKRPKSVEISVYRPSKPRYVDAKCTGNYGASIGCLVTPYQPHVAGHGMTPVTIGL